jgi:hypothetical protein
VDIPRTQKDCQIPCLRGVAEGWATTPPTSLARRIKLFVRRRLSPAQERIFKARTNQVMNWVARWRGTSTRPVILPDKAAPFAAGDLARVRSREEIETTLNHWHQLKGCTFMPEMVQYCGTEQRVLKLLRRFVDERDLRVKRATGIVLLEGVYCQGTADFGPCDRSCQLFWREEWLERAR